MVGQSKPQCDIRVAEVAFGPYFKITAQIISVHYIKPLTHYRDSPSSQHKGKKKNAYLYDL